MNLTEEQINAIKEDIQKGLSSRQIISKYHITVFQYKEIKDSMQHHKPQEHVSKKRPAVIKTNRHKNNVSFLGLIFLVSFLITLFYLIYHRVTGPELGLCVSLMMILFLGMIVSFIIES
jgi:VIT1/CCC1 family predicted Fe2+/Mn2+ transporter